MASPSIAFISRLGEREENDWLSRLSEQMPNERICSFTSLTESDRMAVDIAIVANPDPAHVAALPRLAWIHSLWAGVERLMDELPADAPPVVRLTDPELARTMGEAVLAWTYYLHRDMPAYRRQQNQKCWQPLPYRPPQTVTVGLLGLGALGSEAARRLLQAGFRVLGWSRSEKTLDGVGTLTGETGLSTLLAQSDILVCLVPLTPQTRDLINTERLRQMKPGAALINFARGAVIDSDALVAALDSGHLSHAVLDVFAEEPLTTASALWEHPRITVLPHISAPTSPDSAVGIIARNIEKYRATGLIPDAVNRRRGY